MHSGSEKSEATKTETNKNKALKTADSQNYETNPRKHAETKQTILDMHLACYTQQSIADAVGVDQTTVARVIENSMQNIQSDNLHIFRNFDDRKIYTIWNFPKFINKVKHFGNIPPDLPQLH